MCAIHVFAGTICGCQSSHQLPHALHAHQSGCQDGLPQWLGTSSPIAPSLSAPRARRMMRRLMALGFPVTIEKLQ
jgi:hypothetical protein